MALCKQLGTMRVTICAAVVWLSLLSLTDMAAAAAGRRTDFEAYLARHGKQYGAGERGCRYNLWKKAKKRIDRHNARAAANLETYTMSDNHFADLRRSEKVKYHGLVADATIGLNPTTYGPTRSTPEIERRYTSLYPPSLDMSKMYCMPAIKNQGSCGACWAFAATLPMEFNVCNKYGRIVSLSEQQLISCSQAFGNSGCSGGMYVKAWQYLMSIGGIESNSIYPFTSATTHDDGTCLYSKSAPIAAKVSSWSWLSPTLNASDAQIIAALNDYGPVSVSVALNENFQYYSGGVFNDATCPTDVVNHALAVVGYGTDPLAGDFWIVRNQWGTGWGINGYMKMGRNVNMCNINAYPAYVVIV